MLFKKKKIPCYVLIFDQVDIIKRSLDFLVDYADRLDLVIIENPSPNTPKIKKIVDDFGKAGLVKRYYLFNENITGSAFDVVLNEELQTIRKSPFVLITDGDLTSKNKNWLDEEVGVLENHRDVFSCGISLDMSNLPLETFPEAKDWIPADKAELNDYFETRTGVHLLLLRGAEFSEFMDWKNANDVVFVDGTMHKYCYEELHKKWARTKKSKAYHLTWDLYSDKQHPYTKMKTEKSFKEIWRHNRKSSYELKEY